MSFEMALEVVRIAVLEDRAFGLREPDAVDDGSMVQLVADDDVALFHQRLQYTEVRGEARLKNQRRLRVLDLGQPARKLLIHSHRPGHGAHRPRAAPPRRGAPGHRALPPRPGREATARA